MIKGYSNDTRYQDSYYISFVCIFKSNAKLDSHSFNNNHINEFWCESSCLYASTLIFHVIILTHTWNMNIFFSCVRLFTSFIQHSKLLPPPIKSNQYFDITVWNFKWKSILKWIKSNPGPALGMCKMRCRASQS